MIAGRNQPSDIQRQWLAQQQQQLCDWLEMLQGPGNGGMPDIWQETIKVVEQQVNSMLTAQKQSLTALLTNVEDSEGLPEPFRQWQQQMEEGIALCSEVQQRLWQSWFDMLRATSPAVSNPAAALARSWQEMTKRTISKQAQLFGNPPRQRPAGQDAGKERNHGSKHRAAFMFPLI